MRDKGEFFRGRDRYLFEPFECALFRWDHHSRTVWMKLAGQGFEVQVPHDHRIFNEAVLSGREIDKMSYDSGMVAD